MRISAIIYLITVYFGALGQIKWLWFSRIKTAQQRHKCVLCSSLLE